MTQQLARDLGLEVGVSSGADFLGSLVAQERLGRDAVVATVFCDAGSASRDTGQGGEEPSRHEFLSRHVVLRGYRVIPGVGVPAPAGS